MNISYSRASAYAHCPQKHFFGYVERIEHKAPIKALRFGSDFHKLLQYRANKKELSRVIKNIRAAYYELEPDQQSILGNDYADNLKTIFKDYTAYWKDSIMPTETEHEFNIPIGNFKGENITFKGVIDELYMENDNYIIGEHKTFSKAPDLSILALNAQVCLYCKAVEMLHGKKASAVLWDYVKSSPAAEPTWLEKSNRFSAAASTSITPASWLRACKARDITDEDVLTKAAQFEANRSNFFFRHRLDFIPEMVDSIWNDFKGLAKEIAAKGDTNKRKNVTRDCAWCSYRPICYAEFTGADIAYVKKKDFQPKRKEEEYEAITE